MRFVSTRGRAPEASFLDVLLAGPAPDGGLYVPAAWPRLAPAEIAAFAGAPYAEVAAAILDRFAGEDIAPEDMARMCADAYATFDHAAVAPLLQLAPGRFLLELFHGPSLAFKDLAMQLLARLFEHALARSGRSLTILAATSGDTGGAAVSAFAGRAGVRLVVLYPEGRISEVQRRFMTAAGADNVRCLAVRGDFDACQAILKAVFADAEFARQTRLAAVNSINFARIVAQCVYYFTAATALGAPAREVAFAVPTGNFGDAYACWVARRMGLPVARIIAATNANAIVARALTGGVYRPSAAVATSSPAMDIQLASNFERLHFAYAGAGNLQTAAAFEGLARDGELTLPPVMRSAMGEAFSGVSVDEEETRAAIASVYESAGMLIDPHTAVAVAAAARAPALDRAIPLVVLATAHPAKFPDAVAGAVGVTAAEPRALAELAARPERFERMAADAQAVKAFVRAFVAA